MEQTPREGNGFLWQDPTRGQWKAALLQDYFAMMSPFKGSKPMLLSRHDQCMSQEWLWILACCFALNMKPSIRNNSMTYNTYCSVNGLRENWKPYLIKCMPYKSSTYLRQHLVPPKTAGFWLSPTDINCTTSSTQPLRVGVPSFASPMYASKPHSPRPETLPRCRHVHLQDHDSKRPHPGWNRIKGVHGFHETWRDPCILSIAQKKDLGITQEIHGHISYETFIWNMSSHCESHMICFRCRVDRFSAATLAWKRLEWKQLGVHWGIEKECSEKFDNLFGQTCHQRLVETCGK